MAKRKSTKKEVIDTKEMEIIEISQTEEVVNNNDLNVEKEEDLLDVTEDIINEEDVTADGNWQKYFTAKPASFTKDEQRAYLDTITGVALGSDAFFPFDDNIERAKKSGVSYIAEPGGSIRDDIVIKCADKYGMAMAFTGMRLFHH